MHSISPTFKVHIKYSIRHTMLNKVNAQDKLTFCRRQIIITKSNIFALLFRVLSDTAKTQNNGVLPLLKIKFKIEVYNYEN